LKELFQFIRGLAAQAWLYATFRGKWQDMPESTFLCAILTVMALISIIVMSYIEYGADFALALPLLYLGSVWVFCSDEGTLKINKQLLSAVSLFMIPIALLLTTVGSGHELVESVFGLYASIAVIKFKTTEQNR